MLRPGMNFGPTGIPLIERISQGVLSRNSEAFHSAPDNVRVNDGSLNQPTSIVSSFWTAGQSSPEGTGITCPVPSKGPGMGGYSAGGGASFGICGDRGGVPGGAFGGSVRMLVISSGV